MAPAPAPNPKSPALATLVARGYFEQASDLDAIDDALSSGMVTFYIGFDPTARSLHAGNLLTIMAMRVLQRHGHRPICLLGAGTAMVGDPSGKTEMRKILDQETIAENAAAFREQFSRFLHFDRGQANDALLLNNADWLLGLKYIEFLRDIGRHFTVNRMVAVKTYRDRLDAEIPLSFLEFNYQLLQAYDFYHLSQSYDCTLQLGGSDQWGNMIAGVELIRRMQCERETGEAGATCLTFPLLTTADGRKMGKSERGAVWLSGELLSPFEYYQYWINRDDRDVGRLLRLYTEIPLEEIDEITQVEGSAMREATRRLAFEATRLLHGEEAAEQAETASRQAFGGGGDWSAVPELALDVGEITLVDLLVHEHVQAFKSKRETRKRVEANAVKINDEPCTDPNRLLTARDQDDQGLRIKVGKKRFRICLVDSEAAP
ncbi:MAG: tyrosine--tRNA ligase [Myxococcales bacterium]|nr:tyrosine--tRNA ligase [Myxococcales bacterium]MCB9752470.1 tyrosine--tRNA ligase [Myxococcales bacterium]